MKKIQLTGNLRLSLDFHSFPYQKPNSPLLYSGAPLGFAEDGCKIKVKRTLDMYYSEIYNIFLHQFHNFWVPKV